MKKVIIPALFLFILIFAASCNEEEQINNPVTTAISGHFISEDGTPISSANIEVTDADGNSVYEGITNNDGSFIIENIPQDKENSIVSFSKDGRILQLIRLETLINITKSNSKGNIFLDDEYDYDLIRLVKVVDKYTQEPIENAIVRVGISDKSVMEFTTNSEGIAELKLIDNCFYGLFTVSKDGYTFWRSQYIRMSYTDNNYDFTIELEPKGIPDGTNNNTISFQLDYIKPYINGITYHLSHRKVYIVGENGFKDSVITTGPGDSLHKWVGPGKGDFKGLKSGTYRLVFESDAGEFEKYESEEIFVSGNETKSVYMLVQHIPNLCSNNTLIINFKDKKGNTIKEGEISAIGSNFKTLYDREVLFSNGSVVLTGISKGEDSYYIGEIDAGNKIYEETYIKNVKFDCNETKSVDVILSVKEEFNENCCNNTLENIFMADVTNYTGECRLFNQKLKLIDINGNVVPLSAFLEDSNEWYNSKYRDSLVAYWNGPHVTFKNVCFGRYKITIDSDIYTSDTLEVLVRCNNYVKIIKGTGWSISARKK